MSNTAGSEALRQLEPEDAPPPRHDRGHVAGAVAYLTLRSAQNRIVRQVRRLRSPRVIVALALVALWVSSLFMGPDPDGGRPAQFLATDTVFRLVVLGTFAGAAFYWLIGSEKKALTFTPAEVDFLFPAPLTRRQLVLYKLLRAQVTIFINVVIWTLLLRRGDATGVDLLLRPLSLWVLLATLHLHRLGATLVRLGAVGHGRFGLRRMAVPLTLFGLAAGAVAGSLLFTWPTGGITSFADVGTWIRDATGSAASRIALWPATVVVAPVYAESVLEWFTAMIPALIMLGAHLFWVVRADAAFEEAAVSAAAWRAARVRDRASGAPDPGSLARRISARLPLAPRGAPATALLWKNTLAAARAERLVVPVVVFPLIAIGLALFGNALPERVREIAALGLTTWVIVTVAAGPNWVRNDLRRDLKRLELLRSWPVEGSAIVGTSALSSALALSVVHILAALAAFSAAAPSLFGKFGYSPVLAAATSLVLGLPVLNLLASLVHNGAAILFPAWVHLGPERPGGLEAMGQLYLTLFATLIMLLVLLLLPGAVATGAAWFTEASLGAWRWPVAIAAAIPFALVEAFMLSQWLGEVLERTEPGAVGSA
jgi:ABC-2 type transport system permease protein